ncbi:hypothetical protein GCM10025771_21540 [Niveibacterium umoris]|uniref:Signal transduction histidine kinase n=1 Tax=Niveibacterium umoris TaxID=1193620 RepID=A0A840BP80_9RHOO|nr:cache domain-containing protein [Niveibacterium umoris]MBB4012656.1 signal transduction histidine kinase [Niveibacterium umoris]
MKSTIIGLVIVGAALAAISFKPQATKEDAQAAMDRATRFAATHGNDALVQSLQKANSPLHAGATRVLVLDMAGNVVADPIQPQRVGRNVLDLKDTRGNYLFVDAMQVANAKGEGWVYYKTRSPISRDERREAALVKRQGNVVLLAALND